MKCRKCGNDNTGDNPFCTYCGEKLTTTFFFPAEDVFSDVKKGTSGGKKGFYRAADLPEAWQEVSEKIEVTTLYSQEKGSKNQIKTVVIGRGEDCNIRLHHISVSLHHATVQFKNGRHYLKDNGSTYGTFVNGKRITGQVLLQPSDIIRITNTTFLYNGERLIHCTQNIGAQLISYWVKKDVYVKKTPKTLVNNVSLKINPGEFVAIVGGSGAGKTTFLNCISGYTKITAGQVFINGDNLFENYNSYKSVIAYLPQQDIIFNELTLRQMLQYSAKMRMPSDTSPQEIEARIVQVLKMVELENRQNVLIGRLSGGQRKRASMAVELLSDPGILFLDEPTSGLDPGTERSFMETMKTLAKAGKTVIMVTHTTQNIHLCDKIVFLGPGGNLCFHGTPDDCLKFFGVTDFINIYNIVAQDPLYWKDAFHKSLYIKKQAEGGILSQKIQNTKKTSSIFRQWFILQNRYFNIILKDKQRLLLLLLQAPLIAILLGINTKNNAFFVYDDAKAALFVLVCAAIWIGCSNTIQEVCKERVILLREYMTNMPLSSYLFSKVSVMFCICFIQSFSLVMTFCLFVDWPMVDIFLGSLLNILVTTFLATFSAAMMGLLVSSITKNVDRAMSFVPLLLIPQILFSGILFKLEGFMEGLSYLAISRWAMKGYGVSVNLNSLESKIQVQYPEMASAIAREAEEIYHFSTLSLEMSWYILFIISLTCIALSYVVLRMSLRIK